jgi:hypothetical protein
MLKGPLCAVESDSFQQLRALFHQFKLLWKVTRREKLDRQFARGTIRRVLTFALRNVFQMTWYVVLLSAAKVNFLSNGALWKVFTFRS